MIMLPLNLDQNRKISVSWISAVIGVIAMLITPFFSPFFMFVPFIIQLYRLLKYNIITNCIDLAFLIPFASFYRAPGGEAFIAYFVLFLDLVILIKYSEIKVNKCLFLLIIANIYFILRFGNKISSVLFVCGGLLFLHLIFCNRRMIRECEIMYSFIWGNVLSSLYAYILKDNTLIQSYIHTGKIVITDGRFRGLFTDPNYYSTFLILALICLIILKMTKQIKASIYYVFFSFFVFVGILTISKSFFIMLVVLVFYQIWSCYYQKKILKGSVILSLGVLLVIIIMRGNIEFFNAVIERFTEAETMNDLTSGRAGTWEIYIEYIFNNLNVLLIGRGLDAPLLLIGTHNIYLEAIYNTGIIGFGFFISFFYLILHNIKATNCVMKLSVMRFLPIIAIMLIYFFLQGISSILFYLSLFIMYSCYSYCVRVME